MRLRSEGQRDIRVQVTDGDARLTWADDTPDVPTLEIDAAARHLFIWGRRPDTRGRVRSGLEQPALARVQALLSGY